MDKNAKIIHRNSINKKEEMTWESMGDELFYHKNKFEFSSEEIIIIKKLLLKSPPPLQYRRKVSDKKK